MLNIYVYLADGTLSRLPAEKTSAKLKPQNLAINIIYHTYCSIGACYKQNETIKGISMLFQSLADEKLLKTVKGRAVKVAFSWHPQKHHFLRPLECYIFDWFFACIRIKIS